MAEVAHVDKLIDRVERARKEALGHGSIILVAIHDEKLAELRKLRDMLIPEQREPEA